VVCLLIEKGVDIFALGANQCLFIVSALLASHEAVGRPIIREMMASGQDYLSLVHILPNALEPVDTLQLRNAGLECRSLLIGLFAESDSPK
jgi:hypothetical protein